MSRRPRGPSPASESATRSSPGSIPNAVTGDAKKAAITAFQDRTKAALTAVGYPAKADPAQVDKPLVIGILFVLALYVTMVYGPIAALLVELFPTRIRYTSMSLPYHIGNGWFGGLMPATAFAMIAQTGDVYYGLWYPIVIALATVVIGALFVPETFRRDIFAENADGSASTADAVRVRPAE